MKSIFVNLSNHPYEGWSTEQRNAVEADVIEDWKFPQIDPEIDSKDVARMARGAVLDITGQYKDFDQITVHVMGESVYVFHFVRMAKELGVRCVASTTKRDSVVKDGVKTSVFKFVQFREY